MRFLPLSALFVALQACTVFTQPSTDAPAPAAAKTAAPRQGANQGTVQVKALNNAAQQK